METKLTDGIKKFFLAGVGAVATTVEKSQEIVGELVEKGELTVEQGKSLNEELKHKIKADISKTPEEKADNIISGLSDEEIEALKSKLADN